MIDLVFIAFALVLGVTFLIFYHRNRDPVLSRHAHRAMTVTIFIWFIALGITTGEALVLLAIPPLAIAVFFVLQFTRYCPTCGALQFWFSPRDRCHRCDTSLNREH